MPRRMIDTLYPTMPWDEVDNVVFDIGGVLVEMDPRYVLSRLFPGEEALWERVLQHTTRSPYWQMMDCGTLRLDEAIEAMAENDRSLLEPIRRFVMGWPEYRYIVEEGRDALYTCKQHGKKLYILSNYTVEHYERNVREYDFFGLFDGGVISSRVHMLKPRLDIYRCLADTYGLDVKRTMFIDDNPANIEAALLSGWHGLCFNRPGRLSRFIV